MTPVGLISSGTCYMDVVALVSRPEHVSTRYRIAPFLQPLADQGLTLRLEALETGTLARLRQLAHPKREVTLLQRKLLSLPELLLLRQRTRVLVYDFDDAVYLRDSFHRRGAHSLSRLVRFRATLALADLVIAGNEFLAKQASAWTDPRKVEVVPTCVDPARYASAEHRSQEEFRLVWIGSASTAQALEVNRSLLERIGASLPNAVFHVICNTFPKFNRLRVKPISWFTEGEVPALAKCDVGISVMPDDAWSEGKCGLKILQYMASSLPVVASPVGVHSSLLSNGSGYLASSPSEWIDRLQELSADVALRQKMGRIGRERVAKDFDVRLWGPIFASHLARSAGLA